MALEIFRLVGSVFVDTDKAEKSLQKTDKSAGGLAKSLSNGIQTVGKFAAGVAGAAAAAGGALVAVAESTREYRTEQGKLQAAFQTQNFSAEQARSTYEALNGVLGDSGQAVEAANHLAMLATNEQDLATWTNICTGVYATFGASLPIEGLTEAANETAKTGQLTGALADSLNWAGVNEEKFQQQLDRCTTEQQRQALITETLNGLYSAAADSYREVSAEVIAANMAQDKLNTAMAAVGAALEPFVTAGKILVAEVLSTLTPMLTNLGSFVIPLVTNAIAVVSGWVTDLSARLTESGVTFDGVMTGIRNGFQQAMAFIQGIWNTIGQPVWNLIQQVVGVVAGYFQEKMPAIQGFVRQAFTDIQNLWNNNLKPALTAIGNFINNVLAPAFKFVFQHVVLPVVDAAFHGISQLWTNTLKPLFEGMLDFITGVFTLDFGKAAGGLVTAFGAAWEGIKEVIKAPINVCIGFVNSFIEKLSGVKIPDWVPVVGGDTFSMPTIPYLEKGGILRRGQVGLLEGNGAEAVVPLDRNKAWTQAVARDMNSALGGNSDAAEQLLAAFLEFVAELPAILAAAFPDTLSVNKREFARLVKDVD